MNDTIAMFITWTTYRTWLPGDLRGSPTGRAEARSRPGTHGMSLS